VRRRACRERARGIARDGLRPHRRRFLGRKPRPRQRIDANINLSCIRVRSALGNSFDHLVGAGEQCGRHGEAERLRGDQVDHKLELGRLFDREVTRLCSAQNLVDIVAGAAEQILAPNDTKPPAPR
jgi:hypothetical protein